MDRKLYLSNVKPVEMLPSRRSSAGTTTPCASLLIGACSDDEVYKIEMLMNQAGITVHDRPVVDAALKRAEETGGPAAALQLADGRMVTGKTSHLLGTVRHFFLMH